MITSIKNKKRGFFFILDAVLGLLILVIGVFLISTSYVNVPQPSQVKLLSDDLLNFFSNKKINEINDEYAGIGGYLWNKGIINDGDNTLLQQIGEFYATNNADIAEKFILSLSKDIVPPQFEYEVWINGVILYPQTPSIEHIKSKSSTDILLTSKKLTFGIINKSTSNLWGPYKAEVFVWERTTKSFKSTFTNSGVCQNAENLGLCKGLDVLFGAGYEAKCCSEHSLCC